MTIKNYIIEIISKGVEKALKNQRRVDEAIAIKQKRKDEIQKTFNEMGEKWEN